MLIIRGRPVERWECTYQACGALCCRMERELTLRDIERIKRATGMSPAEFTVEGEPEAGRRVFKLRRKDGGCIFLRRDYGCELHASEAKPILCRIYPFHLQRVIYGDEPIMEVLPAEECPGIGRGGPFGEDAIRSLATNARDYLRELQRALRPQSRGLDAPRAGVKNTPGRRSPQGGR